MPTKRFLKIHFLQGPQGAYGSRAPASQKQGSGAPSKVDRAPGLQGSRAPGLQFYYYFIIIIQIQILVNPELFISQ